MHGKLATVIDRIEHGHHVFRAYFKHAFLKQYEKFATFPGLRRGRLCATSWSPTTSPISISRRDWTISMPSASGSKPSPAASPVSRRSGSTPAFARAGYVDFPLLQRLALPITIGAVRYPAIKIHEPSVIRLLGAGDYQLYRQLIAAAARRAGAEIWAYCLMPNHVHLIETPTDQDGLRATFAEAHHRYTGAINARFQWTGHLFQGRFGAVVMDEPHLLAATRYIALNPVAGAGEPCRGLAMVKRSRPSRGRG